VCDDVLTLILLYDIRRKVYCDSSLRIGDTNYGLPSSVCLLTGKAESVVKSMLFLFDSLMCYQEPYPSVHVSAETVVSFEYDFCQITQTALKIVKLDKSLHSTSLVQFNVERNECDKVYEDLIFFALCVLLTVRKFVIKPNHLVVLKLTIRRFIIT
jgi:hypothetical protein